MTQTDDAAEQRCASPPEPSPRAVWQLAPQVCRVPRLLGEDAAGGVLERVLAIPQEELAPARIRNDELNPAIRRSRTRHRFAVRELVTVLETLHEQLEQVFGVPLRGTRARYTLNVHNDGDFYRPHQDVNHRVPVKAPGGEKVLTFVYYLHRTPAPFTGGALRIYDAASPVRGGAALTAQDCTYREWPPDHDSIIFFRPTTLHEVRPVSCPSRDLADSRFAVNGWLCRPGGA
ncbi:2OG-Fe(II) oxygenase [Streptomyces sp. MAR4 CNX-425]|uniref:2OG-Fe(II) oxygenase n=1 Tax=Streptomyces sp. MAR4 CNX-425 TaxID=3406343 RepID=UPI003B5001DC